jgi:hypothetical protein
MKKQLIILFAAFFICESNGQKLSIELSVEWRYEKSDIYRKLNLSNVPFLKIRYNNLTCDSVFLPKIYKNAFLIPQFAAGSLVGELKFKVYDKIHLPSVNRNVFIGGMPPNNIQWVVLPDSVDFYSEHEVEEINQILSDIYEVVFTFNKNNTVRFDQMDEINDSQIQGELNEDFVFLSPYCNHVEYYNLLGFMVVGGNYSFALSINELNDFILASPKWNISEQEWKYKKVKLPKKAGSYHLYSGFFYTNKIEIKF